jgi:predicted transcriptional regulator
MATKRWAEIRKKSKLSDAERAAVDRRVERELLDMSLREVRELAGKNQVEVAAALEKAQSEISKIENREDWLLSTLRRYVEALGGELEVVAVLGDKRLRLRGV